MDLLIGSFNTALRLPIVIDIIVTPLHSVSDNQSPSVVIIASPDAYICRGESKGVTWGQVGYSDVRWLRHPQWYPNGDEARPAALKMEPRRDIRE